MEKTISCKGCTKRELAHWYLPDSPIKSAEKTLREWIRRCKELERILEEEGYNIHCVYLTPRQVQLIMHYLGKP